jgi:putative redox protein
MSKSHRVEISGQRGKIAGILELPSAEVRGWMLFSHCFTCSKDLKAIVRISRGLANCGWGVLRYDFSGLGGSDGVFAQTNFSTNCEAASNFLSAKYHAPRFLIGHSFGGAASLAMAQRLSSVSGVIAIAAPSDTYHLADLLERMDPAIASQGFGTVNIGGQSLEIHTQMVQDFRKHDLRKSVEELQKAMLIFHSPEDETVGFYHAIRNAKYDQPTEVTQAGNTIPRTLVALPGSNHLLTNNQRDIPMIVAIADAWCTRLI